MKHELSLKITFLEFLLDRNSLFSPTGSYYFYHWTLLIRYGKYIRSFLIFPSFFPSCSPFFLLFLLPFPPPVFSPLCFPFFPSLFPFVYPSSPLFFPFFPVFSPFRLSFLLPFLPLFPCLYPVSPVSQVLLRSCADWSKEEKVLVRKILQAMGITMTERR